MRRTTEIAVLALAAGVACKDTSAGLVLVFPDDGARGAASTLSLYVLRPAPEGETPLCDALTRATLPIEPTAAELVRDAVIEDAPVDDFLAGASRTLESLPSGDKVLFVRVEDEGGLVFLRGCAEASLGGGASLELELDYLPGVQVDAMPDARPPDAPPIDAAILDLRVIVAQAHNPTLPITGAHVDVTDFLGVTRSLDTDANGHALFPDVGDMVPPWDVTVVGEVFDGATTFRGATTLIDVEPAVASGTYQIRAPLETAPPAMGGAGTITGTVTNIPGGHTAEVQIETLFVGPPSQNVAAPGGTYTHAALKAPETYSMGVLVRDAANTIVRFAGQPTIGLTTPTDVQTVNFNAGTAAAVDVASTGTLSIPGVYTGTRTFGVDVLLGLGVFTLREVLGPSSPVNTQAPLTTALPPGGVLMFRLEAADAAARARGEVRQEITAATGPYAATLAVPSPPTISAPTDGLDVTETDARTLALAWTSLFSGHSFVHLRLAGDGAGIRYRWNLIFPAMTTSATLPALPAATTLLARDVTYEVGVAAIAAPTSFRYRTSIAGDFTSWTRAFNTRRRAWRAHSVDVTAP